jgi:hypothetical protein
MMASKRGTGGWLSRGEEILLKSRGESGISTHNYFFQKFRFIDHPVDEVILTCLSKIVNTVSANLCPSDVYVYIL